MQFDSSRRKFLQAGLVLPEAGFVASHYSDAFGQAPAGVVYRALGKTGLKVSGVGCGIGIVPDPAVLNRAVDLGVNYFDTARMCYECKGKCPKGVPVTDELRFLAYNDFGGNFPSGTREFQFSAGGNSPNPLQ